VRVRVRVRVGVRVGVGVRVRVRVSVPLGEVLHGVAREDRRLARLVDDGDEGGGDQHA